MEGASPGFLSAELQDCPDGLAGCGVVDAPLVGDRFDEEQAAAGLVKTDRGAWLRWLWVGVVDFDPEPSAACVQVKFRRGCAGTRVENRVGDQLGDHQDSDWLKVVKIP